MLKAPPVQTANATIDTLCGRLQSATLLEDRRGAILGLRAFAKQYPASVASGALRELIATLRRDGLGDVDTTRLVLETLLMLFHPDDSSPEAGEEISLFVADEFSMHQENITLLLSLLDPTGPFADYYCRLNSIRLLQAICSARPERFQECLLGAGGAITSLVELLDDGRDVIRSAGLLLLVDLTDGANDELRKIVAFQDIFPKVFSIIRAEGGLAEAGITAHDCLTLLHNLLRDLPSNRTVFRESGCVREMVRLLQQVLPPANGEPEALSVQQDRERAGWGLLKLLIEFLRPFEKDTVQNQQAYWRAGMGQVLVDLGFNPGLPSQIRAAAIEDAAALIASNEDLQKAVQILTANTLAGVDNPSIRPTHMIEGLLYLTLSRPEEPVIVRAAACHLLQTHLADSLELKISFANRAMGGYYRHASSADGGRRLSPGAADVWGVVFASWLFGDVLYDSPLLKAALAGFTMAKESEDEDTLTGVQTLLVPLQTAVQVGEERLVAAYAGVIAIWLWEFEDGVDQLLEEGSILLQSLTAAAEQRTTFVAGLSAFLLGTLFEFSTESSPIPRSRQAKLILQKLGRDNYRDSLDRLRKHPAVRDVELSCEDTFLSEPMRDLILSKATQLQKAIDGPHMLSISNGTALSLEQAAASAAHHPNYSAQAEIETLRDLDQGAAARGHSLLQKIQLREQEEERRSAEQASAQRLQQTEQMETAQQLQRLTARHADLEEKESQARRLLEETTQKLQDLTQRHAQLEARSRDEARQLHELMQQHKDVGMRESEAKQRLENLQVQLVVANREKQQLWAEVERVKNESQEFQRSLSAQVIEWRERLSDMETELVAAREKGEAAERQNSQLRAELESVAHQSEKRQELVIAFTSQIKDLRDKLAGSEKDVQAFRAQCQHLERKLEESKDAASATEYQASKDASTAGEAQEQKISALEQELKEARNKAEQLQEDLDAILLATMETEVTRDKYKARVMELGGEVTEDEDDEEGEDRDEDVD
ncbi:hypothetical protein M433DRAFT_71053 [Acidomyces richmondensis BFW]|nr:MAG: hypothetical protein FE78DRAFT_149180 [Acidomyces sp. 'richmondensis']KYG43710.1 hypothetical protein M433DRAFT_71053 [Acidomyces richmondensis BFW]